MRRLLFLVVTCLTVPVTAQQVDELFVHRAAGLIAGPSPGPGTDAVVSRTSIGIRIDALFDRADGVARRVIINAGPHSWTARLERVDVDDTGFRSWVGHLEGVEDSHAVFTERNGVVSGLINAVGITYQVRTHTPGTYVLERIDTGRLGDEPDPLVQADELPSAHSSFAVASDEPGTFDVLMLYTPAARLRRGGTAQIEALASQVISDTNTAFARSGAPVRVRLVATRELSFAEAAQMTTDLPALRSNPEARALRDAARADLVQLLVSSPDQSACGVGYLLTSLGATSFDAYSIADVACAAQYTPTHEMGHNMGAHHAPEDGAAGAMFPYSYGFKDPARGFRTVMAYSCTGVACARVLNFSNPAVAQNGGPTGSPSQNNARSILEAAPTVANFRQSGSGPGLTPPSAPTGLRSAVTGTNVTVSWDPVLADLAQQPSAATAYVLQAGTAPGLANLFNSSVGNVTSASGTLGPGTYFWRVIAINSAGPSAPSPDAQFTIACAAPPAPANFRFSVAGRTVTLSWGASTSALPVTYTLEAGSSPTLSNLLVTNVGPQTAVVTPAPAGTYYVRVRAQSACGTSAASNEQTIVVP
jgi:hypothetical protein